MINIATPKKKPNKMNIKAENNNFHSKILNETSFLIPSSSESVTNNTKVNNASNCARSATLTSQIKPTIINHFQIKKAQSFNKPIKIENSLNEKNTIEIKIQEINSVNNNKTTLNIAGSPKLIDSKSAILTTKNNHVQFVLPVNANLNNTNLSQITSAAHLLTVTPSNTATSSSNSSINNINNKSSEFLSATTTNKANNRIQSTLPLKNIATIRSSSFRNRNLVKYDTNSSLASALTSNAPITTTQQTYSNNKDQSIERNVKSKTRSYENINMIKVDEQSQPSIHRLIKMASNWNGGKNRSDSSASSNYFRYPKVTESSLISQSKIRQTQIFLNDENKCVTSCESVLSRKISDYDKRLHAKDDEESTTDKLLSTNRSRTPVRNLPITSRITYGNSDETESKKSSATEVNEKIGHLVNSSNNNRNTIWSHINTTNSASEISDGSASVRDSSITSYLNRKNKSFDLVQLNRNLNTIKINQSSTNQLNRVTQMPIQI